eukprot:6740548-Heterocapsa_arctica.AAC.1
MLGWPIGGNMVHSVLIVTMYTLISVTPQYLSDVAPRVPRMLYKLRHMRTRSGFMLGSPTGANMSHNVLILTIYTVISVTPQYLYDGTPRVPHMLYKLRHMRTKPEVMLRTRLGADGGRVV